MSKVIIILSKVGPDDQPLVTMLEGNHYFEAQNQLNPSIY